MDMSILSELEELQRCLEESDSEDKSLHKTREPSVDVADVSNSDVDSALQSFDDVSKETKEVTSRTCKTLISNKTNEELPATENSDDIVKEIFGNEEHTMVGSVKIQHTKETTACKSVVLIRDAEKSKQPELQPTKEEVNPESEDRKPAELERNLETKNSVTESAANSSEATVIDFKNPKTVVTDANISDVTYRVKSSESPASNLEDAVSDDKNLSALILDAEKSTIEKNSQFMVEDSAKLPVPNAKNSVDCKDFSVSIEGIVNLTETVTKSEVQNNLDCPESPFLKIDKVFSVTPQVHKAESLDDDVLMENEELEEQKDKESSPEDLPFKKRKVIQMDTPSYYDTTPQKTMLSSSKKRKLYTPEESDLLCVARGSSSPEACLKLHSSDHKVKRRLNNQFSGKKRSNQNDMAPSCKKIKLTENNSTLATSKSSDVGNVNSQIPLTFETEPNRDVLQTVNPSVTVLDSQIYPVGVEQKLIEREVERFGKKLLQARVVLKRLNIPIPEHLLAISKKEQKRNANLQKTLAKVSKEIQEALKRPPSVPKKAKHGTSKQENKKPSTQKTKPLKNKKSRGQVVKRIMLRRPNFSARIGPKRKRILTKKILASKLQEMARARRPVSKPKKKTTAPPKTNNTNIKSILAEKDKKGVNKKVTFNDVISKKPDVKTLKKSNTVKTVPKKKSVPIKKNVPVKKNMPEKKVTSDSSGNKIYAEQEKKTISKKASTVHEQKNIAINKSENVNSGKNSVAVESDDLSNKSVDKSIVRKRRGRKSLPKPAVVCSKFSPAGMPLGRPRKTAASSPSVQNPTVNMGYRLEEKKVGAKSTPTIDEKEEDSGNDGGEDEWIVEMLLDDEAEVLAMRDTTRVSSSDERPKSAQTDRNDVVPECDSSTDKNVRSSVKKDNINNNNAIESPKAVDRTSRKVSSSVIEGVPVVEKTNISLERKMAEMKKAIGDLERIADRSMLRLKAEERQVIYLSNKLETYENDKHYKVLRRILKDAAPGPNQNMDAAFIIDLMLSYCPNDDEDDETAGTSSEILQNESK